VVVDGSGNRRTCIPQSSAASIAYFLVVDSKEGTVETVSMLTIAQKPSNNSNSWLIPDYAVFSGYDDVALREVLEKGGFILLPLGVR